MKTLRYLIGGAFALTIVASSAAQAGVVGSAHDLSLYTAGGTAQVCVYCHTPHNAASGAAQIAPLWNHTSASGTGFTLYTSTSLDSTPSQPSSVSLACLSCHDGTVALDSITNNPAAQTFNNTDNGGTLGALAAGAVMPAGNTLLGKDLSNDHPVSIAIPAVATEFNQPSGTPLVVAYAAGGTGNPLPIYTGNKVECGSCHNPHDTTYAPFLRGDNSGSDLCLSCHVK